MLNAIKSGQLSIELVVRNKVNFVQILTKFIQSLGMLNQILSLELKRFECKKFKEGNRQHKEAVARQVGNAHCGTEFQNPSEECSL